MPKRGKTPKPKKPPKQERGESGGQAGVQSRGEPGGASGGKAEDLDLLLKDIRGCRICRDEPRPRAARLPHEPRPVLRVSATARICICGQAPGTRVHASGMPFTDPSGVRLREWMGVSDEEFYDERHVAVIPMGFCFPGLNSKGADLPPRPECRKAWHTKLFGALPQFELLLLVGGYAQVWHLGKTRAPNVTQCVQNWRQFAEVPAGDMSIFPTPHPSWRNNAWIKKNPWFEDELVVALREKVRAITG